MSKIKNDKVDCQYCGKEFTKAGITNHEKACEENPVNVQKAFELEEIDIDMDLVDEIENTKVEETVVEVRAGSKINSYIGNRYYRIDKGEVVKVPLHVKEILREAGLLATL